MANIDEVIADARAEEEVARAQAEFRKKAVKEKEDQQFKEDLKEHLKEALFNLPSDNKISISLREYVELRQQAMDLERIVNAIVDELELSYNEKYLTIKNEERVADTIRVLYPDAYDNFLAAELEHKQKKEDN